MRPLVIAVTSLTENVALNQPRVGIASVNDLTIIASQLERSFNCRRSFRTRSLRHLLAGCAAIESYLPSKRISLAIAMTFKPSAYDAQGDPRSYWGQPWGKIGKVLTPHDPPVMVTALQSYSGGRSSPSCAPRSDNLKGERPPLRRLNIRPGMDQP